MTTEMFLRKLALRAPDVTWCLQGKQRGIRTTTGKDGYTHCPLSWLADAVPCGLHSSAQLLHMSLTLAERIADAADNVQGCDRVLRRRLMKAVGL